MQVKAREGVKVPYEHRPSLYITEFEPVEVENSIYYQRRLADGDLFMVVQTGQTAEPPKTQSKNKKGANE
ncbi:hypothetical protein A6A20_05220 [Volucribacter amazonae]|uniref:DUF2635 domain-containing protein n=1 Tax=Volucribacter amazonae TaxID=256731 RepID=A0A9X4PCV2_9PAST|nr:hypothetical protein [Volucribacter amazonae]